MAYKFIYTDCNICGSKESLYLGRRIPIAYFIDEGLITDIVRCKNCGLIYPNPMPFPDKEQSEQNYRNPDEYFPTAVTEERLRFYDSILKGINRYIKNGKILDVGCGRGELLYLAKKQGWEVCGAEISKNFADYAKKRFGIDIKVGEVKDLNFSNEEFNVICLISVLQHIYNPKGLLYELNRILKKKGLLFIETMNNASLVYKMGDFYYRLRGSKKTTHLSPTFPSYQIYGFSVRSILRILQITGFKIIKIQVKGGISSTERYVVKNFADGLLRLIRKLIVIIADLLGKGQVLIIYAIKEE